MIKRFAFCIAILLFLLQPSTSSALCVSADEANLRSGPGTNYDKTWEVYKYMPLEKLEKKGLWYKVRDFEGDVHWVYGPLVTSQYKCAVVRDDKANVRTGPGTNYDQVIYSPVLKYYTFKVITVSGDWAKVVDDYEDTGWIFKKLLWIR